MRLCRELSRSWALSLAARRRREARGERRRGRRRGRRETADEERAEAGPQTGESVRTRPVDAHSSLGRTSHDRQAIGEAPAEGTPSGEVGARASPHKGLGTNVRRSSPVHSRPLVPALLVDRDDFSKCVHRRDYPRGSETTDCARSQLALRGSARLPVSLARLPLFKFVTSESPRLGTPCPVRLSAELPGASRGTAARSLPPSCCRPLSRSLCLRG